MLLLLFLLLLAGYANLTTNYKQYGGGGGGGGGYGGGGGGYGGPPMASGRGGPPPGQRLSAGERVVSVSLCVDLYGGYGGPSMASGRGGPPPGQRLSAGERGCVCVTKRGAFVPGYGGGPPSHYDPYGPPPPSYSHDPYAQGPPPPSYGKLLRGILAVAMTRTTPADPPTSRLVGPFGPRVLRACNAMSSTEVRYAPTRAEPRRVL
eukprot:3941397-Rhodomonas_salina.2